MEFLLGQWAVERRVVDLRTGREGEFAGTAQFEPADGGLRWDERGRLRLGGFDGPAGRRLLVMRTGDGWMVAFADGRPFHALDLASGVEYRCGDDLYTGEYRRHGADELRVRWDVTGPRKRQRIRSIYRRC
jgi:Family of unknown function (DUF6314)